MDGGVSEQPLRTSCNTLPENVLADLRLERESQNGPMAHASAVKMRGSDGVDVESSSALTTLGIAHSRHLGGSKPTTE